ncbi:Cof-type HAD-IIB family hydrolase [Clostridium carnis]
MEKIKLICIDMDGTLLNSKHEVSEENKNALKQAKAKGINVAITTGRLFASARYYSNLIGIDAPVIASNGAYIKNKYNDIAILENTISTDVLIKIYEIVKKYNLFINFNTWDTVLRETDLPSTHAYVKMNEMLVPNERVKFVINEDLTESIKKLDGKIIKGIVIEDFDKEKLLACKEELKETFGEKLHVVSSGTNNFEIMNGNSSKGSAVAYLADTLGIDASNVMCIGDSENDISMIQYAGVGVAMGNALDIVKEVANDITSTNEESGVAKAILKYI